MANEYYKLLRRSFTKISDDVSNATLFHNCTRKGHLVRAVVSCLERIETEDKGINWWQDLELMSIFRDMHLAGVLPLPFDAVERIRWIALLCIKVCERANFSYGNLLNPLDYLPDEQLDDRYGESVLGDVTNLRSDLRKNGWKSVLGW